MNTLTIIEKIAHLTTELIYAIACLLYLTWQYRCIIITMILFTIMGLIGIIGYGMA